MRGEHGGRWAHPREQGKALTPSGPTTVWLLCSLSVSVLGPDVRLLWQVFPLLFPAMRQMSARKSFLLASKEMQYFSIVFNVVHWLLASAFSFFPPVLLCHVQFSILFSNLIFPFHHYHLRFSSFTSYFLAVIIFTFPRFSALLLLHCSNNGTLFYHALVWLPLSDLTLILACQHLRNFAPLYLSPLSVAQITNLRVTPSISFSHPLAKKQAKICGPFWFDFEGSSRARITSSRPNPLL